MSENKNFLYNQIKICMIFLQKVYLGPGNNRLDLWMIWFTIRIALIFMKLWPEVCLRPTTNPFGSRIQNSIIAPYITDSIVKLSNLRRGEHIFPNTWKTVKVTPLNGQLSNPSENKYWVRMLNCMMAYVSIPAHVSTLLFRCFIGQKNV